MDPDPLHALQPSPRARAAGERRATSTRSRDRLEPDDPARLPDAGVRRARQLLPRRRQASRVRDVGRARARPRSASPRAWRSPAGAHGRHARAASSAARSTGRSTTRRSATSCTGCPAARSSPAAGRRRSERSTATTAPIRDVTRDELLAADVIVTNFHSLGTGEDPDDLLAKLAPDDIDFIVVDEAHIAAADSYQRAVRALRRRADAADVRLLPAPRRQAHRRRRRLPLPAHRLDRRRQRQEPPRAAVRARRRADDLRDGLARRRREEIVGREALLEVIGDERKLARITAKSTEPIRQVMRDGPGRARPPSRAAVPGQAARPVLRARRAPRRADRRASPTSTASRARTCTTR